MMNANQIRQAFLDFFRSKGHEIVPSAPMVVKNDPTLMFINSGMAPFKDVFLGNSPIKFPRVADTQKCLRVSGKHNDLEEVGIDTYHHTMFEMLGNWSFGDYFKKEAIAWAWELLTDVYKIDKDRLYVTVFEGDKGDGLAFDQEAYDTWKQFVSEDRILNGNKKDNFWEMGDQGPCGPCSEIHYDGRSDEERKKISGASLVNNDHPQVIEIWNNVFMEFERRADGSLVKLPKQHVDTGMGFERLVRVLQNKKSNYDTDVFTPLIQTIALRARLLSGEKIEYGINEKTDIAIRVIADHIRTISFAIADGQLPSNNGAGYVIRRILRRAVRYAYSFLNVREVFLCKLVDTLAVEMKDAFPEIERNRSLIIAVIEEEEKSFLRTLANGINRFEKFLEGAKNGSWIVYDKNLLGEFESAIDNETVPGYVAFELYDTYGFPFDLTTLLAKEQGWSVDEERFKFYLEKQKTRSRNESTALIGDWNYVKSDYFGDGDDYIASSKLSMVVDSLANDPKSFVGYDTTEIETYIFKYREVKGKGKSVFQLVLSQSPFYAESGGQVGDAGVLENSHERISIIDTRRENGLRVHISESLPEDLTKKFIAKVNSQKRRLTENNHSSTHLLHAALRKVLGTHVEQKGSLVNEDYLRFDFSHFSKVTDEEIARIEKIVNEKIRENISSDIREMSIDDAKKTGAMALFGEKYGDTVRVVTFDKNYSIELCGGTHVKATGQIGLFKITSEAAVAAGIRRIEACTAVKAEEYLNKEVAVLNEVKATLKNPKDVVKATQHLLEQNALLSKQVERFLIEKSQLIKGDLKLKAKKIGTVTFIGAKIDLADADAIKNLASQLRAEYDNAFVVLGAELSDKASITVAISDLLSKNEIYNAGKIVREIAKEINGGGGGQVFLAQAGGTKPEGINNAIEKAKKLIPTVEIY